MQRWRRDLRVREQREQRQAQEAAHAEAASPWPADLPQQDKDPAEAKEKFFSLARRRRTA